MLPKLKNIIISQHVVILVVIGLFLGFGGVALTKAGRLELPPFLQKSDANLSTPSPTPTSVPTPTPTPKPLTFEERNKLYGPCVHLPTIMYHHIRNLDVARSKGDLGLSVDPGDFRSQMQYLKDKGYTPVSPEVLTSFFDSGASVPSNSILITFDDGYDDFAANALPVLKEFGFKATLFLPTGLVNNQEFLTWDQVQEAANSGLVYIANHTWSHHSVAVSFDVDKKEIETADTQLKEHGLNQGLVFAYPYGNYADYAISILQSLNYKLAFTTVPGSTMCKQKRFTLPRIRIGNAPLSAYGF
ncbi:MAG TPA: polysaccharide deacetylase family protein [Patescibacteria group bacterium]